MNLFRKEEPMKLPLKRIAAVALTVCLLGVAAGTVHARGGRPPAPQPQPQPQPQPKPQPQPQPQPKPAQQKTSSPVIGSLSSGSTIGSLSNGSTIGSLSNGSTIGSLSNGSTIGSLIPTNSQPQSKPKPKLKDPEPERGGGRRPQNNPPSADVRPQDNPQPAEARPQDNPQPAEARPQNNPPPQSRPAEQPKPVEPEPQIIVQELSQKPAQAQDPIIITPRSVRAGNASGGGKNTFHDTPGYSGGDGTGPLIYNP
jgi:hypothetical protein